MPGMILEIQSCNRVVFSNSFFEIKFTYSTHFEIKFTHLHYMIQWILEYSQICVIVTVVNFGTFSSLQKETHLILICVLMVNFI